jgi:GNAT superfamily N-acetyltransferase
MITYQVELADDCFDEVITHAEAHDREVNYFPDVMKIDPSYVRYRQLEDSGVLRVVTARDNGSLVGYIVSLVSYHINYQATLCGSMITLYVDPAYRNRLLSYRMFKFAMDDLIEQGATILSAQMNLRVPYSKLLRKLGFQPTHELWEKATDV